MAWYRDRFFFFFFFFFWSVLSYVGNGLAEGPMPVQGVLLTI
jgi:hypothetical protein